MNALQGIDVFNIVMGLGILVLILAIRDIERSNGVLRDANQGSLQKTEKIVR